VLGPTIEDGRLGNIEKQCTDFQLAALIFNNHWSRHRDDYGELRYWTLRHVGAAHHLAQCARGYTARQEIGASARRCHVLEWFKAQGRGYLTRMNAVLRSHMEAHKHDRTSPGLPCARAFGYRSLGSVAHGDAFLRRTVRFSRRSNAASRIGTSD
jgi:hypothetical protein